MIQTFELAGRHFDYQLSEYNRTRLNERAVEVPVGLALLGQATDAECEVLEVGAVLPHYRAGWPADRHTVIDLHEEYPGVINADVLTWQPPKQFDLIISISTLDHLHDYEQLIDALRRLRRWLAPDGLLYVTLPYGQPAHVGGGPWIDRFVLGENDAHASSRPPQADLRSEAAAIWRLDKTDPTHHLWTQILEDAPHLSYNGRAPCANTVYMLLWGDVPAWWKV